jgi:hypothetical protein
MRLPRVRFTVRRMMAAVAIAAALLGPLVYLKRRSDRFWTIHLEQAALAQGLRNSLARMNQRERSDGAVWMGPMERSNYHKRLSMKYREAALRPWLPIEPDPPKP